MRRLLARQLSSQAVPAHYPLHAKAIARVRAVRFANAVIGAYAAEAGFRTGSGSACRAEQGRVVRGAEYHAGTNRGLSLLGFGPTVTKGELKGADLPRHAPRAVERAL
jgi:hypothetical protein